jgi:hypothetical protein
VRARASTALLALCLLGACGGGSSKGETFATSPTSSQGSVPATSATITTAAASPDRAAADRMAALLEQSSASRGQVAAAVQGTAACSLDPGQAAATFGAAAQARQSVLASVTAVDLTGLAEGPQLKALLQQALQHSAEADRHFQTWAQGLSADGCDRARVTKSTEFAAADAASGRATAAKNAFVAAWNPVAARYGLRQWAAGDI